MNCLQTIREANPDQESPPDQELYARAAREVRNRQAAALHLRTATRTDIEDLRRLLRRRAAELILPRRSGASSPKARSN